MSETIPYQIKRSGRARHARLTITPDKKLTVTLPLRAPLSLAQTLVAQHKNWIIKHLMRTRPERITLPSGRADYLQNKHQALSLVRERLHFFNQHYHFHWKSISIKNASTRWGSCSRLKNLNFNYKIIYLPPELQDYLIVHELCHLEAMNHGEKFWHYVGETIPNYQKRRKNLRLYQL